MLPGAVEVHTLNVNLYFPVASMLTVRMWGESHAPWMQTLHCAYGIGSMLGPLVAEPFLKELKTNSTLDVISITNVTGNVRTNYVRYKMDVGRESISDDSSSFRFAYYIIASLMLMSWLSISTVCMLWHRYVSVFTISLQ